MMAGEIRTKIEQREIQLERRQEQPDDIGWDDVDGIPDEDRDGVNLSMDVDRLSELDDREEFEKVNSEEGAGGGSGSETGTHATTEEERRSVLVVESYGEEGSTYLELKPINTVL